MPHDEETEARIRAACEAKRWEEAATLALQAYGQELMSYLVAVLRDTADADDAFGTLAEGLWRGLPSFRWEASLRTYLYTLARHAWMRRGREAKHVEGRLPLSSPAVEAMVGEVRSRTATFLRTETKDQIARVRASLDPDDQTLLILRIDRRLSWKEIAAVMSDPDETGSDTKRAAALRKRFERLKADLRARVAAKG